MIAGSAGGLSLKGPPGATTRPITDRVKESVFAHLGPVLPGAVVLDLFAGSGALAIEALSRGAHRAVLVERDPGALSTIEANLAKTRLAPQARVHRGEVIAFLGGLMAPEGPFDLVFADPPYDLHDEIVTTVISRLDERGWLADGGRVVVRRSTERTRGGPGALARTVPPPWVISWQRSYGDAVVAELTPAIADRGSADLGGADRDGSPES